jgi:hypothetical protein
MNKKIVLTSIASILLPGLVLAATSKNLASIIDIIISYANRILVLMMGIAVVMFVFYVIKYFIKADADRTQAGSYVMWSLIGFFVILSMWGLVNILQNTFGLQNDTNRPSGWNSFTNIFPGGGTSNTTVTGFGGGTNQGTQTTVTGTGGGTNQGSTWYNPAWNDPNSREGEQ